MIEHEAAREALLDRIGDAPLAPEIQAHLEGCAECRSLANALSSVDEKLLVLPSVPEELITRTLARLADERAESEETKEPGVLAFFAGLLGAIFGGLWTVLALPFRTRARRWSVLVTLPALGAAYLVFFTMGAEEDAVITATRSVPRPADYRPEVQESEPVTENESTGEGRDGWSDVPEFIPVLGDDRRPDDGDLHVDRTLREDVSGLRDLEGDRIAGDFDQQTIEGGRRDWRGERRRTLDATRNAEGQDGEDDDGRENGRFETRLDVSEGLAFQEARGYWANTYVPGDPAHRLLRGRLADAPAALALAEHATPVSLGLDPPRQGALALSLRADRASVESPSRVTLAVGLRGADVPAGRRGTLSTMIVIDARTPLDDGARQRVRELLTALSRDREGGDRAGVVVAGPHGGVLVPQGELRFGTLSVALDHLEQGETAMPLDQALRTAIMTAGDPNAPPASALVLLVTPSLDDAGARALEPLAHAGALAGVTTSAIGLDAANVDALGRVALAGQGRRVVLDAQASAERVLASEVAATSRVVARAARLSIRLAPGVSLVGVLGSRRLDGEETTRVRESERAIDRDLAQSLGIVSDRHGDEDGIQIVIPAFYAGDEHAVLLDLVAGPGAVADVSLRWKDLTRPGNASAEERFTLAQGTAELGPRERSVVAARLGHELTSALEESARLLERGDRDAARARIGAARARIEAARDVLAPSRLSGDLALVAAYEAALARGDASLSDSLRYAGIRRAHGDPIALDATTRTRARARPRPAIMNTAR